MDADRWLAYYKKNRKKNARKVFIKVMTSDGKHFFFHDYDEWYGVKEYCDKNSVKIQDLHLQFRSNRCIINIEDASEGIYLVRSVLGMVGVPTKHYYTVGRIKDGQVHKQMWIVPELIKEQEFVEDLSDCFEEATIIYESQKNRKE